MNDGGHHPNQGSTGITPAPSELAISTSHDVAPGIAAISSELAAVYSGNEPMTHWESEDPMRHGGRDVLEGVSAFFVGNHWHYVSMGLTQLFEKGTHLFPQHDGVSGFGFELTFRLRADPGRDAPAWPVLMLQRLAHYVYESNNLFEPGDHLHLNGPIGAVVGSHLTAVLFTPDRSLKPIHSRFGSARFLQLVGVTYDELEAVKDWRCEGFLEVMLRENRALMTDVMRHSHMLNPRFAAICREGARQEGSSHGSSYTTVVEWKDEDRLSITVGAIAVPDLLRMLTLRLPFNRPFRLHGRDQSVHFVPGLGAGWESSGNDLVLSVPWDAASAMASSLEASRGTYLWPGIPGVALHVVPTEVYGSQNELLRIIG